MSDESGTPPPLPPTTVDDFARLDIRVGRILRAETFPAARVPAFRLEIDFGVLGVKRSSARITKRYSPDSLVGRLVVAVVNFPPRQIATFMSEVLVLGACPASDDVILLAPDMTVELGTRIA